MGMVCEIQSLRGNQQKKLVNISSPLCKIINTNIIVPNGENFFLKVGSWPSGLTDVTQWKEGLVPFCFISEIRHISAVKKHGVTNITRRGERLDQVK